MRHASRGLRRSARRRNPANRVFIAEQAGFTLVEALLVMTMTGVIFAAAVGFYQVVVRQTDSTQARAASLADVRTGMDRITRDVREAKTATISTAYGGSAVTSGNVLTLDTPTARVVWDCTSGSCTRTVRDRSTYAVTEGPVTEIGGLDVGTAVFTSVNPIASDAANVQVRLSQLPDGRDRPIVLSEDVAIRNDCVADPNGLLPACA